MKSNLYYDESKIGIENYILKTENQILEAFSTNQSYVILNAKFLRSFINDPYIKPTSFIFSFQKITIRLSNSKTKLSFITNNNIIGSQNKENIFNENVPNKISNNYISNSKNEFSQKQKAYYESQINDLKNQLNEEKKKNQSLIYDNNNLRTTINKLNTEMKSLNDKIKLLENDLLMKKMEIQKSKNKLNDKYEITYIN